MKIKNKKKFILRIVLITLGVIFLVVCPIVTGILYHQNFGYRAQTVKWQQLFPEDFPGLKMDQCYFQSDKGQKLAGYKFSKDNQDVKGIVVISHGYGGAFNTYMCVANYFASNGYYVFGYDCTGCDNSQGKGLKGLPQGVIDLDYAIRYIESCPQYKDLPIMLFGHSWGGYCVTNVLNVHPEVAAVVSVAGFNKSKDLIKSWGRDIAGPFIYLAMPYISIYEKLKFGKYSSFTAQKGFDNSEAGIMSLHSRNDTVVSPEFGYDLWYKDYTNNPRFKFCEYEDRGHNHIYYDKSVHPYDVQFCDGYNDYVKSNNLESTEELVLEYSKKHFDKSKYYKLDENVMGKILEFYNSNL